MIYNTYIVVIGISDNPMKAKVADRGQVTIPKALRDRLGIRSGTILDFSERDGLLIAEKTAPQDALDAVYGSLGQGRHTDDLMDELRGGTRDHRR